MKIDDTTTLADLQEALKGREVTFATIRHTNDGEWQVRLGSLAAERAPWKGDGQSLAAALNAAVASAEGS